MTTNNLDTQRQFKYSKIIYHICSVPVFCYIVASIISAFSFRHTTLSFNLVYMLVSLCMATLLYLWYFLNYKLIQIAYRNNSKQKEIVVILSCLSVGAILLSGDFIVWSILLSIIPAIINACIFYTNKQKR